MASNKNLLASLVCLSTLLLPCLPAGAAVSPTVLAEIAVIPVGDFPVSVALSPDGSRLFVAEHFNAGTANVEGNVTIIDTSTNSLVGAIALGPGFLARIRVTPDGTRAYLPVSRASGNVTSAGTNHIAVVDLQTSSLADTVPIASPGRSDGPIEIDLLPNGSRAYVSDRGNDRVLVVDTDPLSADFNMVLGEIGVPGEPIGIGVTADGSRAYVAARRTSEVSVIDTVTNVVFPIISVPLASSSSLTSVALSPDGTRAYVTYAQDSCIAVIDTDPTSASFNNVIDTVSTPEGPLLRIRLTPDGAQAFVLGFGNDLLVLDTDPQSDRFHEVLRTIAVGNTPTDVVFPSSSTAVAYVSNGDDDTVSVIGVTKDSVADLIANMDPRVFRNPSYQKTLLKKMGVISGMIDHGMLCAAVSKLSHDILPKTDGAPSPPDWLIDSEARAELRGVIEACIGQLLVTAGGACP